LLVQYQNQEGTLILTAEMQGRLVEEAGFIDIQVIENCIGIGTWNEGLIHLFRPRGFEIQGAVPWSDRHT